jgi:hypothetical protein
MGPQVADADALVLARKITANREVRLEAARLTRNGLKAIGAEGELTISLPTGQPARRDTYRTVNAVAHQLLGSSRYRLRIADQSVVISVYP